MNWTELVKIKAWTPLHNFFDPAEYLGNQFYQVSENIFFVAQPYNQNFIEGLSESPFVTLVYWAISVEVVKHYFLQNTKINNIFYKDPPMELLLSTDGTYEGLLKLSDRSAERAVYSAFTGDFLYKIISIGNHQFFFANKNIDGSEKPFAIEVGLL